jgi:uncharacterized protein YqeY
MADSAIKLKLTEAMKDAMRAKDKARLGAIRLALAGVKKVEVDERIEPDDTRVLSLLEKMIKQRRESIRQYEDAKRSDLADIEKAEIVVLQEFMPAALGEQEIDDIMALAIQYGRYGYRRITAMLRAIVDNQVRCPVLTPHRM